MRRINLLACLELDFANGKDMPGAFIEQLDDLRVELVNCLAMFGKAHVRAECRIKREESIRSWGFIH